jgi:hypothetical protein
LAWRNSGRMRGVEHVDAINADFIGFFRLFTALHTSARTARSVAPTRAGPPRCRRARLSDVVEQQFPLPTPPLAGRANPGWTAGRQ